MTDWPDPERQRLHGAIAGLIARLAGGERNDAARDALLMEVLAYQVQRVEAYGRLVRQQRASHGGVSTGLSSIEGGPAGYPALPTDVFRYVRVGSFPVSAEVRCFRTSGTTQGIRGTHVFADLSLYDQSAYAAARFALFPDVARMRLLVLAPAAAEVEDSSLSYMLARFGEWFGSAGGAVVFRGGHLQVRELVAALREAESERVPVALLGTSFAFVHAEDALGAQRFALAPGSRIMQTGGYKGRSREVEPGALRQLLVARYGVAPAYLVQEYGMTELSSQLYSSQLRQAFDGGPVAASTAHSLWVPPWVRVAVVDPETLQPLSAGETGLLRIDDLANLDSVSALQTADLAYLQADGVVLVGRSPGAVPRGCSLSIEEALGWVE